MKKNKQKDIKGEKKESNDENYWLPIGMCLGISIGSAIGAATNNIGLWLPVGLCIGIGLGAAFSDNKDKDNKK